MPILHGLKRGRMQVCGSNSGADTCRKKNTVVQL